MSNIRLLESLASETFREFYVGLRGNRFHLENPKYDRYYCLSDIAGKLLHISFVSRLLDCGSYARRTPAIFAMEILTSL
jgi:hypothetical protein